MKKMMKHNPSKKLKSLIAVLVVAVVGLATVGTLVHAASGAAVYLAPSAGTYTVGDNVAIQVREDGNGTPINAVQLGIQYPAGFLQFQSVDSSAGAFTTNLSPGTQKSGEVIITFIDPSGSFTDDQQIATLNFTAIAAGSAPVTFSSTCQAAATSDCSDLGSAGSSIGTSFTGGTYTIQAASTTPPVNNNPPPSSSPPASSGNSSSGGTSITPKSSNSSITAPTNSQVQVSTPATIEPATIQPDGVQKIEYYLNNKLVYTATEVPFAYHFDTTHLLNGTYTLKTISYYDSGRTTTSTQKLIVSNPFSFTQFGLLIGHYAWFIIPLIIILVLILVLWLGHNHLRRWFNRPRYGSTPGASTPTNVQGPPSVVTPSGPTGAVVGTSLTPQAIPIRTDED